MRGAIFLVMAACATAKPSAAPSQPPQPSQPTAQAAPAQESALQQVPDEIRKHFAPGQRAQNVPPAYFDSFALSEPAPPLTPGLQHQSLIFKICIGLDGNVAWAAAIAGPRDEIAPALAVVRSWKFRPPPLPICSMRRFVYD